MIPYGRQHIDDDDISSVLETLNSNWLTQGPKVPLFEQALAAYCSVQYGVAVNSATSALHLACLALGISENDTVWTSPNSFVASANCARYCRATVDFVDIDIATGNMCCITLEKKLKIAQEMNCLPKAIIPVHFAGQSCNMEKIAELARQYNFKVIEDASHAVGAEYKGKPVGSCEFSDICVFSFHPVKIITTLEGGMAVTNNPDLANSMRLLRSHGVTNDPNQMQGDSHGMWYYQQIELGFNYRMNDVEAALGLSQLNKLNDFVARRQSIAKRYQELLKDSMDAVPLSILPDNYSSFHLFVVKVAVATDEDKRRLVSLLRQSGILAHVHYIPIHMQPYYQKLGFRQGDFPQAECYYNQAITLPIFPSLTMADLDTIIQTLKRHLRTIKNDNS